MSTHSYADNKLSKRTISGEKQTSSFFEIHQQKFSFEAEHEYQAKSYVGNKSGQCSLVTPMKIF